VTARDAWPTDAITSVGVLTPHGSDAPLAVKVLGRHGIPAHACADMDDLTRGIAEGIGALLIAEEALLAGDRAQLLAALEAQPVWSDIPVVLLVSTGELSGALSPAVRDVARRGNVTLLERPVRVATLTTTLDAALRARARQYDTRDAIAERITSTRQLEESEERMRAAVEAAPFPLMVHADDGTIVHLSRTWYEFTGYTPEQLTSLDAWTSLAYGDEAETARMIIRQDLTSSRPVGVSAKTWEHPVRIRDGSERIWSFHAARLGRMSDGRALRLVAAVDVTDMRRMVANERTLRTQAEAANMAKMQFLATMSHELRTPLNAIGGHVQLIELGILGPVSERQVDALRRVRRAESHLLGLINDVLNFAKIEAGHVTFDLEPTTIGALFEEMDSLIAPQVQAKGLSYSRPTHCDELCVVADLDKARQVLLNLLSNAVKFTNAGGRITVECERNAQTVAIHVTDTGVGVAADALASIFEPFVQVRPDYTATNEGTGLGLAISRDLARAMNGDLSARSVVGEGSTFTLTLPLAA
jgi:PAS domain S-box-containing protein